MRLARIDLVAFHHLLHGLVALIMLRFATQHVVEHPHSQSAFTGQHLANLQLLEGGHHNGQTCCQHWRAMRLDAAQVAHVHLAIVHQAFAQQLHAFQGDALFGHAVLLQDSDQTLGGAGGAIGFLPACLAVLACNAFQFTTGGQNRIAHALLGDHAIGKEFVGIADTAHVQGGQQQGLQALANNHFSRSTTNINHQTAIGGGGQLVADTGENQTGFLVAGDDLDGKTEGRLGSGQNLA